MGSQPTWVKDAGKDEGLNMGRQAITGINKKNMINHAICKCQTCICVSVSVCPKIFLWIHANNQTHALSKYAHMWERESGTWVQSCVIPEIANIRSIGTLELEYIRSIMVLVVCSKSPQTTCPKPKAHLPERSTWRVSTMATATWDQLLLLLLLQATLHLTSYLSVFIYVYIYL